MKSENFAVVFVLGVIVVLFFSLFCEADLNRQRRAMRVHEVQECVEIDELTVPELSNQLYFATHNVYVADMENREKALEKAVGEAYVSYTRVEKAVILCFAAHTGNKAFQKTEFFQKLREGRVIGVNLPDFINIAGEKRFCNLLKEIWEDQTLIYDLVCSN